MHGKKAIQQLIIVLFIIIAIGALLVAGESTKNTIIKIGDRQFLILNSYLEAEKTRDYYTQIARLAVQDTAKELGMNLQACIMADGFSNKFPEKVSNYDINYDLSSNPQLTVVSPRVAWSFVKYPDAASIYGTPEDVDPRITVSGENFQYDAGLYVSYTFCVSKCGDGLKQGTEECDIGDFGANGNLCQQGIGQGSGGQQGSGNQQARPLKCTADCKIDYSVC